MDASSGNYELSENKRNRGNKAMWNPISEAKRFIKEFSAEIGQDSTGDNAKLSGSSIYKLHGIRPINAQRIQGILAGEAQADRQDLINISFFVASQEKSLKPGAEGCGSFIENTNKILRDCFMGELSCANPSDSFLIMCMHTSNPLTTYADVWKMSFANVAI
jgi:hypothetical protein